MRYDNTGAVFKFHLGNLVIDHQQYDRQFIILTRHRTPRNDSPQCTIIYMPQYTMVAYKYEYLLPGSSPSGHQRAEQHLELVTERLSDEELLTHWHELVRDLYYHYHPRPNTTMED